MGINPLAHTTGGGKWVDGTMWSQDVDPAAVCIRLAPAFVIEGFCIVGWCAVDYKHLCEVQIMHGWTAASAQACKCMCCLDTCRFLCCVDNTVCAYIMLMRARP